MNVNLEKYILSKKSNHTHNDVSCNYCDIVFKSDSKNNRVTMYCYHDIFKNADYITFYKISDECLYFSLCLSFTDMPCAYKLSKASKHVKRVQVRGENAKKLKCFRGDYFIHQVDINGSPYFYISKNRLPTLKERVFDDKN